MNLEILTPMGKTTIRNNEIRGSWLILETILRRPFTLFMWPDSEPTKLLAHFETNSLEGRGGRKQIKQLPQKPFAGYF